MAGYIATVDIVFANPAKQAATCKKSDECAEKVEDTAACASSCPKDNPCEPASDDPSLGKVTRNPFFNFLRVFRRCNKNMSAKQLAMDGARKWKTMNEEARAKYIVQAFKAPKKYYQNRNNMNATM